MAATLSALFECVFPLAAAAVLTWLVWRAPRPDPVGPPDEDTSGLAGG